MTGRFDSFIQALSQVIVPKDAFNQYSEGNPNNTIRRENLRLYLNQMVERQPRLFLLGEAPSYQGMRLTGVPFGSEYILLTGVNGMLGAERGYRKTDEIPYVRKEPTATILWGVIRHLDPVPLLWGAFPFHPFKAGNPWSNRPPRTQELRLGEPFVRQLLELFPTIKTVVAVGRKAEVTLGQLGVAYHPVRHPAQGGKNDFVRGMAQVVKELEDHNDK